MERSNILDGWKYISYLPGESVGKILYNSLKNKPNDILWVEHPSGKSVTRKEFLDCSIKVAIALQKSGIVKAGDVISIVSPNSWKYMVLVVASQFIGAVVGGANPSLTVDELEHNLKISAPKVVFASSTVADKVREVSKKLNFIKIGIIDGDTEADEIHFDDIINEDIDCESFQVEDCDEDGDCFLFFSSGTTGLPKGVLLSRKNIAFCLNYVIDPVHFKVIEEDSVVLTILPFYHIFGMMSSLGACIRVDKIILLDRYKPDKMLELIQDYKVTTLFLVPYILHFFISSPLVNNYDISSIRTIIYGGAPAGIELERTFLERFENISIRQIYGCTEASGALTITPKFSNKEGSVGKVVMGQQIKIWDSEKRRNLGPHEIGEICMKGLGVMSGYKGNELETKASFDSDGYLLTGDAGYFDEDGFIFIVDRMKELIKYKGCQVPPAFLEDILLQHPAIKEACVVGKPDVAAGELPTAFVVKKPDAEVGENEILQYVAAKVSPEKYLRGGVIFIGEIPRGLTGKMLRSKLKKLLE